MRFNADIIGCFMMISQRTFVAVILLLTSSQIGHGLAPPDITGLKVALGGGFDVDLDSSRSYVLDSRNQPGYESKIWCMVEGEVSEVTWYFNEEQTKPIESNAEYYISKDNIGYFLQILYVNKTVEGSYHCEAENSLGKAMSQYVNVSIAFIDTYNKEGSLIKTMNYKEYLKLDCHPPASNPAPIITWKNNEKDVPIDERVQMDPTGNLYISDLIASDAGSYNCYVKNQVLGQTLYSDEISIGFGENPTEVPTRKPVLVYKPKATTIAMRKTNLKLQCIAQGNPTPSIRWEKVGGTIKSTTTDEPVLEISNFELSDVGTYRCIAQNSEGSANAVTNIVFEAAPYVGVEMVNKEVVPGETAVFTCDPQGAPEPQFNWLENGMKPSPICISPDFENIFFSFEIKIVADSRYAISKNETSSVLTIGSVSITGDSGTYTCNVDNQFGNDEGTGTLTVLQRTVITEKPSPQEVQAGNPVTLNCKANAYSGAPLVITWEDDEGTQVGQGNKFTIKDSTLEDSGQYTCVATTDLDEVRASTTITVQDKPGPLARVSAVLDTLNEDMVSIEWEPGPEHNSPITSFVIQSKTEFDSQWSDAGNAEENQLSKKIDVDPGNTYTFRMAAVNKIGTSDFVVSSSSVVTPSGPPRVNPKNVAGSGKTPDTMTITWDKMERSQHGGDGFKYFVMWRRTGEDKWMNATIDNYETTSYVVEGTTTYESFDIKVIAVNNAGKGPEDEAVVIGHAGEAKPGAAPADVVVTPSPDSIRVNWTAIPKDKENGKLLNTKIFVKSDSKQEPSMSCPVEPTSCEYSGVKPNTKYEVYVRLENSKGLGPSSNSVFTTTPEGAPSKVMNFMLNALSDAMKMTWRDPEKSNGVLQGFTITYAKINGQVSGEVTAQNVSANTYEYIAEDLDPGELYSIKICAYTNAESGEEIKREQRLRPAGSPGAVDSNSVDTETTNNGASIVWKTSDEGPAATKFVVRYRKKDDESNKEPEYMEEEISGFEDPLRVNLRDLEEGTKYEVIIDAINNDGTTSSDPIIITTSGTGTSKSDKASIQPWVIAMICIILLLVLILLLLCFIRSQKGGKYNGRLKSNLIYSGHLFSAFLYRYEVLVNLRDLEEGTEYEVIIDAINNDGTTSSDPIIIRTSGTGTTKSDKASIQPWVIAMICIILLLVLILLLLCFIRSQKGGKYNVSDKEDALRQLDLEAAPLKDQNGFNEYSPTDDSCEEKDPLKNLESAGNDESDSDSLADYADGNADQFNEDGSFINEYGDNRRRNPDKESSNAAYNTFV
ncbi:neuronal cell adhesion molecule-like [Anneissia japonica]|uniref:neuronal cell adhesion molecule-like n=1 Tax=Anneissia japonica TaxID=1529436 RepID=UPI001425B632|nr:neuronal cell adhesion molecule-like [Anneissia japonica]